MLCSCQCVYPVNKSAHASFANSCLKSHTHDKHNTYSDTDYSPKGMALSTVDGKEKKMVETN